MTLKSLFFSQKYKMYCLWAICIFFFSSNNDAYSASTTQATNGELLYTKNCITCHTAQVHWRERKLATDFKSLQAEVNHWQTLLSLDWSNQEVEEVSEYLDALYYHFLSK